MQTQGLKTGSLVSSEMSSTPKDGGYPKVVIKELQKIFGGTKEVKVYYQFLTV